MFHLSAEKDLFPLCAKQGYCRLKVKWDEPGFLRFSAEIRALLMRLIVRNNCEASIVDPDFRTII